MSFKILKISLLFVAFALVSFSFKIKKNADLTGFWVVENTANKPSYDVKVFEKSGKFYNLSFESGKSIISHRGKYKILNEKNYKETVTGLRFNAKYDLLNKEFINNYELNKDKTRLILSGIVVSKNGTDTLKWSHVYKRMEIPN